ncbi:MAG: LacI family DNA-binding transcriptional regulator [Negativicutes bacterium]
MMRIHSKEQQPAVTIKDVAKKAGTSIATVSYVISNQERPLRPELRERVLQAAAELGYVKNAAASSLKGKRRGILAVLVAQFANTFFTRMCVDIESIAREEGYIVTLCNSDEDPAQERLILERLIAQRIDGCVLCPAMAREENTTLLSQHRIPYVILERSFPISFNSHNFVGHDNFQSGFLATRRLLEAGHRKIAFSGWDSPIPNVRERVDGYRAALREYGVTAEAELVLLDELAETAGRNMGAKLLAEKVTAAVLGQQDTAKGTLLYFQDLNVQWPRDISLVMIGTPEWAGFLRPRITCIQRPEQQMGRAAASLLFEVIRTPGRSPVQRIFPCTVIERESVQGWGG